LTILDTLKCFGTKEQKKGKDSLTNEKSRVCDKKKRLLIIILIITLIFTIFNIDKILLFSKNLTTVNYKEIDFWDVEDKRDRSCGYWTTLDPYHKLQEEIIIYTKEDYKKFQDSIKEFYDCNWTIPAPEIDFSREILLGKYVKGGGCETIFNKKVYRSDESKKVIYSINVKRKGLCAKLAQSNNFITIDKIPLDYEIEFKTN